VSNGQHAKLKNANDDAQCAPDDAVKDCPLAEKVGPTLNRADPGIVLVARDYMAAKGSKVKPHRLKLKLGTDSAHDGKATLSATAEGDTIELYSKASGGKKLALPLTLSKAQLQGGYTVYISALKASSSVDTTVLELKLSGGTKQLKAPVTTKLTCVELKLDVHKCRPDDGSDPPAVQIDKKIEPGAFVHVKHTLKNAAGTDVFCHDRIKLVVHQAKPAGFAGKLVLKGLSRNLQLFAEPDESPATGQAVQALPLSIDNASIDATKGRVLWIEGATTSKKLREEGLTLGVEGLADREGDRVVVTVIETKLEIMQSRTSTKTPAAIAVADKLAKGRFVHVQQDQHHGRAMLIVSKVKPKEFTGKLKLSTWDATGNAKSTARLQVFEEEVPAAGQAAKGQDHQLDHTAKFPKKGVKLFVEGKAVSAALVDGEVRLAVEGVTRGCDRAALTVVRLKNLKADIPSTPAATNRGAVNSPVARHEWAVAAGAIAGKDFDEDYATNEPVVLLEGSVRNADPVKLSVEVEPANVPVLWSVQRDTRKAKGDHKKVTGLSGNPKQPTVTPDGGNPLKATLFSDACGSFHVRPFVDCNGSGKFEHNDKSGKRIDREPYVLMNLVLVRAQMHTDTSRHRQANVNIGIGGGSVNVSTGNFANGAGAGVHCKAKVELIGGGNDGKRGLDYVFGGWINNELVHPGSPAAPQSEDAVATYQGPPGGGGAGPVHTVFSFWTLPPGGGFTKYGPPPPALPAAVSGPTLDCTNFGNEGTGGNRAVGTEGAVGPPVAIVKSNRPGGVGEYWTIEMWDSPGDSSPLTHPAFPGANLINYRFNLNFRVDLCFWTSQSKAAAPTAGNTPACRLYASVATHTWNIRYSGAVNAAAGTLANNNLTIRLTKDGNGKKRAIPVDQSGLETRGPCTLDMLAVNQST
jgi:uncharacterized protein (DUF2141 family)